MKTIRCSMLPAWDDCARRTAGRQFAGLLAERGHNLRSLLPSVGASIGTAVHRGAAHLLIARLSGIEEPSNDQCVAVALDALAEQLAPGAIWDTTSPNLQTAFVQVERMLLVYLPTLTDVNPLIVESEMRSTINNEWELSGHVDLFTTSGDLDDLKTGVPPRTYMAQMGGYALNLEANGHQVRRASMVFVRRARLKNKTGPIPQPLPVRTEYDLTEAKLTAWRTIQDITRSVDEFEATGDPHCLRANPMSLMCSEKYCSSWDTEFCTVHQKPKETTP